MGRLPVQEEVEQGARAMVTHELVPEHVPAQGLGLGLGVGVGVGVGSGSGLGSGLGLGLGLGLALGLGLGFGWQNTYVAPKRRQ